jgi:hypothetical protein
MFALGLSGCARLVVAPFWLEHAGGGGGAIGVAMTWACRRGRGATSVATTLGGEGGRIERGGRLLPPSWNDSLLLSSLERAGGGGSAAML